MDDLRVRPATPADEAEIVALMSAALGDGMPRETSFWRWKHENNPFGRSLVLVAEDADGLVGLRAMMRWTFMAGAREIQAVRPVDTATHPRVQRRGLFTRLTKALLDQLADAGVGLVFNTPNEKSRPGYLKLGWQSAGPMTVWVRPGGRFAVRGGGGRQAFDGDALLVPDLDDGRLHTARTPAYLRWRYGEVPSLSYGIAREGDLSVVFRARARGGRDELTVCELVLPDGPAAIARSARLVRRVVRQGRESQAVAMAARGTREAAVLALAGFVPVPRSGPHLVVRRVPDGPDLGLDPALVANWRAQVGDLEVF